MKLVLTFVMFAGASGVLRAESLQLNFQSPGAVQTNNGNFTLTLALNAVERVPPNGGSPQVCNSCQLQIDGPQLASTYNGAVANYSSGTFSVSGPLPNPHGGSFAGTFLQGIAGAFSVASFGQVVVTSPIPLTVAADPSGLFAAFDLFGPAPYTSVLSSLVFDTVNSASISSLSASSNALTPSIQFDTTPEPSALLLAAGGLAACLMLKRRESRKPIQEVKL